VVAGVLVLPVAGTDDGTMLGPLVEGRSVGSDDGAVLLDGAADDEVDDGAGVGLR
jgi:hypothetical protein